METEMIRAFELNIGDHFKYFSGLNRVTKIEDGVIQYYRLDKRGHKNSEPFEMSKSSKEWILRVARGENQSNVAASLKKVL